MNELIPVQRTPSSVDRRRHGKLLAKEVWISSRGFEPALASNAMTHDDLSPRNFASLLAFDVGRIKIKVIAVHPNQCIEKIEKSEAKRYDSAGVVDVEDAIERRTEQRWISMRFTSSLN